MNCVYMIAKYDEYGPSQPMVASTDPNKIVKMFVQLMSATDRQDSDKPEIDELKSYLDGLTSQDYCTSRDLGTSWGTWQLTVVPLNYVKPEYLNRRNSSFLFDDAHK